MVGSMRPAAATGRGTLVALNDEIHYARDISAAFKQALDKKKFNIDIDDGEDVLVKNKGSEPDFGLTLVESTVKGARIDIKKE